MRKGARRFTICWSRIGLGWSRGPLDKASEGLLLLTNDSEWAAKITEPASHLDKKYHVQVDCVADADLLARVIRGCTVEDAAVGAPAQSGEHLRAKERSFCGTAIRTVGWRLRWTKARTGRFAVCSKRWRCECCGWCECRLGRSSWRSEEGLYAEADAWRKAGFGPGTARHPLMNIPHKWRVNLRWRLSDPCRSI